MSHEITQRKSGKSEMAYVGEKPWHGLGQELQAGAPIEDWVKAAGMDWDVQRAPVFYGEQGLWGREILDRHVLFRSDTQDPLGIVSKNYKIVQPQEVLEFFRELCEFNHFEMNTAGTLFGGRIYWALANIGEEADVRMGDKVKGRLLLSTSADGTKATTAKFVAERVVCNNTLTMAMREGGGSTAKVSHRSEFKADKVKTDLGIGHEQFENFIHTARLLTEHKVTDEKAREFFISLLIEKGGMSSKSEQEVLDSRPLQKILGLYMGEGKGSTFAGTKGTAWGLVNAVTEYIDHLRPASLPDFRFNNAFFGFGERMKMGAFNMAQDQIKAKKGGKK